MKRIIIAGLVCVTSVLFGSVDLSLDVSSLTAIHITNGDFLLAPQRASLSIVNHLSENVRLVSRFSLTYNPLEETTAIHRKEWLFPVNVHLDEAYLRVRQFLWEPFDLVIGKQRISWGKADGINPTDVWNPIIVESPLDMAQRVPTLAVNLTAYLPWGENTAVQAIWQPFAARSVLPLALFEDRLSKMIIEGITNVTRVETNNMWREERVFPPAHHIGSSAFGGKIRASLWGFDVSTSFVSRYNDIPYVKTIEISNTTTISPPLLDTTNVNIHLLRYELAYHREIVWGFDAAKDLGFALAWAELAVIWPQEVHTTIYNRTLVMPFMMSTTTTNTTNSLKHPYVKYVVGMDRNFGGGWYVNLQYAKGLLGERGHEAERPQDYIVARLEKSFANDTWKIAATGMVNIESIWESFGERDIGRSLYDTTAYFGNLELSYSPIMGLTIGCGIIGIDGRGNTTLSHFNAFDAVYLSVKTSF